MTFSRGGWFVAAAVWLAVAVVVPVHAQGNGKGKGRKSTPPSSTVLPSPTAIGATAGGGAAGASPFAWIDDASTLEAGMLSLSISAARWHGADLSEVDVPIVDISVGLAPRVQLGVSIPRVVGSADPAGAVGGVGTSYVSGKIGLLGESGSGVRLAISPTLEILGKGAAQALEAGERRTRVGLPVSAEIDRGGAHVFGSAGYFSGGVWFTGAGVGAQASPRVAVSVAFSRAWTTAAASTLVRDRTELSGGAAVVLTPQIALFGSVGRTIATTDDNGAGTTIGGGISFTFLPATPATRK